MPELLRDMTMEIEQQFIRKALKKSHGNIGRCARICGLSRRSISAKIADAMDTLERQTDDERDDKR